MASTPGTRNSDVLNRGDCKGLVSETNRILTHFKQPTLLKVVRPEWPPRYSGVHSFDLFRGSAE